MQFKLYHLANSRSQRIVWLFAELDIPYELIISETNLTNANKNAKKVVSTKNNAMKFPTLEIIDKNTTITLTESSAIAEYLCQQQQKLGVNLADEAGLDFCFYKHYVDASLMPLLSLKQVFQQIVVHTPWLVRPMSQLYKFGLNRSYLDPELKIQLEQLNRHLESHHWLAGNTFSYVDILLWFPLHAAQYAFPRFEQYSALIRYLNDLEARPAFQQSLQIGAWNADQFQYYWSMTRA